MLTMRRRRRRRWRRRMGKGSRIRRAGFQKIPTEFEGGERTEGNTRSLESDGEAV